MKNNLKTNQLALVMGCAVQDYTNDCVLILTPFTLCAIHGEKWDVKPYLRPPSDLKKKELVKLASIIGDFKNRKVRIRRIGRPTKDWHPSIHKETMLIEIEAYYSIASKSPYWVRSEVIQIDLEYFEITNSHFKYDDGKAPLEDAIADNLPMAFQYLLSREIDIFNWVKDGRALCKITHK